MMKPGTLVQCKFRPDLGIGEVIGKNRYGYAVLWLEEDAVIYGYSAKSLEVVG